MLYNLTHALLQLMWIESILGHSFLLCNLLWPCSLIETLGFTDRERFHIWSLELLTEAERSREEGETRRGARAIVLLRNQPINQFESRYVTSAPLLCFVHRSIYIYINPDRDRIRTRSVRHWRETRRFARIIIQSCYFDYRINQAFTCSGYVISILCSVLLMSTYYARKGS